MRNMTITTLLLGILTLGACGKDEEKDDTATCPADTATDTGSDTAQFTEYFTCTDSTGTHVVGETWTCPDGCNTCGCLEQDVIASTNMVCDDGGDTATPVDTGTDTGATDTGTSGDTGGDTSSG
jgi:hypothetical protein